MRVCVGMRWIEFTRKGINKCKQDYTNKYKLPIDYVTNIFVCIVVGLVTMDANVEALGLNQKTTEKRPVPDDIDISRTT